MATTFNFLNDFFCFVSILIIIAFLWTEHKTLTLTQIELYRTEILLLFRD